MTKLSYQLYSARNFQPYSAIFEKLGKAGYAEVEGFGGIYADLDDAGLKSLRAELDKNGLVMASGHFSPDFLEKEVQKSLNIAKILGMDSIYAPHLAADQRPSDAAGWTAFGKRLQEMSKPYKDAGYEFGWHNHDFEFVKLADGSLPIERIFEARLTFPGKPISPGLSAATPIPSPGLRNSARASPRFTSRTLRRPAKRRMRMAGPMSATARSSGPS